ncbi:hypothetical protein BDY19DRAFT_994437 [Irpex rosettiformis]|uniref:Uncharacterized protein n=1 Tax=Irpex rosettiformis TaxID=378272 RepID=A0ACB8U1I1_9APHY|nr:hypothetical protein BDY19DRAFT_994437 [Irpex rosettiformis]
MTPNVFHYSGLVMGLVKAFGSLDVAASIAGAQCLSGSDWMLNRKGQTPCIVAAYLSSACDSNSAGNDVEALRPRQYRILLKTAANDCFCNTVMYSLLGACATCEGLESLSWSNWTKNCTKTFVAGFPKPIPEDTAIPEWAYYNITLDDSFNATLTEALASENALDFSVLPVLSSPSISQSTTSDGSEPTASDISVGTDNPKTSKAGPIVGGVIGGVALLVIIGTGVASVWAERRKTARRAPSAMYSTELQTPASSRIPDAQKGLLSSSTLSMIPELSANKGLHHSDDRFTPPGVETMASHSTPYITRMHTNSPVESARP